LSPQKYCVYDDGICNKFEKRHAIVLPKHGKPEKTQESVKLPEGYAVALAEGYVFLD